MAYSQNIDFFQGDDVTLTCHVCPIPTGGITGWTIEFKVASTLGGVALITIAGVITDADMAEYTITIPSASTLSMNAAVYYYDIRKTNVGSQAEITNGRLTLKAKATE